MAKVSFSKLKLDKNTSVSTFILGAGEDAQEIEVKKYLPIDEKQGLVELTVQSSITDKFVNPIALEKYFNLYLIYKYTNIGFTEKQRENEGLLYDLLDGHGIIDKVIEAIGEDYDEIRGMLEDYVESFEKYASSLFGILSTIIDSVPQSMSEALSSLEKLDLDKLTTLMEVVSHNAGNETAIMKEVFGQK